MGVIEIQGDDPYYFRHSNLYKLRQFATFFGDYYYRAKANKWLQEIIDSASNDDHQIAYHAQCKALTNLFLASGAGIWICDPNIKGAYQLKGFYGSDKINDLLEIEPHGNFFRVNSNSEGANFLKKRKMQKDKDSFFIVKPYTPTENPNAYKQALKDDKFDHILLFAVNDINDYEKTPHAIITIHNKTQTHNDGYPTTWGKDIAHISQFIASAFSIMHSVSEEKRKRILLLGHDLRTNIGQLENNAINMLKRINNRYISPENKIKHINFVVKNDLQPIVEEARQQIEALCSDNKSTAKEVFFSEIQRQKDEYLKLPLNKQFSNFREAYNTAFENRDKEGELYFRPLYGKENDWMVRMSMGHLNKILMNLIQNAQKYSSIDTIIEPKIYEEFGALIFELKNHGKKMQSEEEAFFVFNYKFRGTNGALMRGEGLGLWQVKHITELYDASLFFDYNQLPHINLAEYIVRIQFYNYK